MSSITISRKPSPTLAVQIRKAEAILRELKETLEDLDDRLALARAVKRNKGKPLHPWSEVAKELGIPAPPRKR
jgi:hypothetical protein